MTPQANLERAEATKLSIPTKVRKESLSNIEDPKYFICGFIKSEKAIEQRSIRKMCQKVR
jgi:hypothetical protein